MTPPVSDSLFRGRASSLSTAVDGLDGVVDSHKEVHNRNRWQREQYVEALWCCQVHVVQVSHPHRSQWNKELP